MPYSAANDPQASLGSGSLGTLESARSAEVPTRSDTVDLTTYAKAFYCASAGVVKFIPVLNDDAAPITMTVVAGSYHPIQVRRIFSTTTTVVAGDILVLRGT